MSGSGTSISSRLGLRLDGALASAGGCRKQQSASCQHHRRWVGASAACWRLLDSMIEDAVQPL
jgi:hypothetical protein